MSMATDESIKPWAAKRRAAPVVEILHGGTPVTAANGTPDLSCSEIGAGVEDVKKGTETALQADAPDIREHYETLLEGLQETCGEAMPELRARKR